MELTGNLYGFYSNKPISNIFKDLNDYAKSINFKFQQSSFEEYENILFYKDEIMLEYHSEKGYNTELEGEGCFHVEAKKTKLKGMATLFEFEGEANFEPFDINLAFTEVYYYVLTIPHFIENDKFSQQIHTSLLNILTKD